MTKTYIAITILSTVIFQFCLTFFTGISLKSDVRLWSSITVAYAVLLPYWGHYLDDYIQSQITLHKERIQNRKQYELFKSGVKDGLFTTDEQVERENRRIVK